MIHFQKKSTRSLKVLLHGDRLSPAGAGVVGLAGGDLALEGLHLGLAGPLQGSVHRDVST